MGMPIWLCILGIDMLLEVPDLYVSGVFPGDRFDLFSPLGYKSPTSEVSLFPIQHEECVHSRFNEKKTREI